MGTREKRVHTILHVTPKNPQRDPYSAWKLLEKHGLGERSEKVILADKIISKYRLKKRNVPEEEVRQIVLCSIFLSALRWKEGGSFEAYALESAKDCRYWINQLNARIGTGHGGYSLASRFLARHIDDPEYTLGKFAQEEGLSRKRENALLNAVGAMGPKNYTYVSPAFSLEGAEQAPSSEALFEMERAKSRLLEIMQKVLGPKHLDTLCMRFGIGTETGMMELREIAEELGIPVSTAGSRCLTGLQKMRNSSYAKELRELLQRVRQ